MAKLCVLGLGYIGLPTAAMFATSGFQVVGVDINERVVHRLRHGDVHIIHDGSDAPRWAKCLAGSPQET